MVHPIFVLSVLLLIGAFEVHSIATSQRLREMAQEHARRHPGEPMRIPGPPRDYAPKPIEDVAREADVVLRARLTRIRSYVNPTADYVATDYAISEAKVVAGRLSIPATKAPGDIVPLILSQWGGEAMIDGVLIRAVESGQEPIQDGGEYVLFLRPARPRSEAGRYEIYNGAVFEVTKENVKPLLHQAKAVFKGTVTGSLDDLIRRIQTGGRGPVH